MDNDQGYVTAVAYSPMLGQWIGTGAAQGRARSAMARRCWYGTASSNIHMLAEVVDPCFYDKEHKKLHA
jgi:methylglutamate dehydrogenase subunit C